MQLTVAIQPDDYTNHSVAHEFDSSSYLWAKYLKCAGHKVRWVNAYQSDIVQQLKGCDGFMWRWGHCEGMYRIARRILPIVEDYLKIAAYPNRATCWHYDDKISQAMLFETMSIPTPKTWVFFCAKEAVAWAKDAEYPLVAKLATGAGSSNVKLIEEFNVAKFHIERMFSAWNHEISLKRESFLNDRFIASLRVLWQGRALLDFRNEEPQRGYVYFQEFQKGNAFDTRVTVIGNRAFAFRRWVRNGDFRASGSGQISYDKDEIDIRFVELAFETAGKLAAQSLAMDGFYSNEGTPVIGEISYAYSSWAIRNCPGHWEASAATEGADVHWVAGQMWPEEAQVTDFVRVLESSKRMGC